jgi:hypothetical protein
MISAQSRYAFMLQPLIVDSALGRIVALALGLTLVALAAGALRASARRDSCCCAIRGNTRIRIHTVQEAILHYEEDHAGHCPPSLQALVAERYLTKLPRDQWGRALRFTCSTSRALEAERITPVGKDGHFGSADGRDVREL